MEIMGVSFSKEEALEIIGSPNFWSELVFTDGYEVPPAYAPEPVTHIQFSFTLPSATEKGGRTIIDLPQVELTHWPDSGSTAATQRGVGTSDGTLDFSVAGEPAALVAA